MGLSVAQVQNLQRTLRLVGFAPYDWDLGDLVAVEQSSTKLDFSDPEIEDTGEGRKRRVTGTIKCPVGEISVFRKPLLPEEAMYDDGVDIVEKVTEELKVLHHHVLDAAWDSEHVSDADRLNLNAYRLGVEQRGCQSVAHAFQLFVLQIIGALADNVEVLTPRGRVSRFHSGVDFTTKHGREVKIRLNIRGGTIEGMKRHLNALETFARIYLGLPHGKALEKAPKPALTVIAGSKV